MLEKIIECIKNGICKVKTHSGEINRGDVFVAMPGVNKKGVDFIPQAIEKGARYIISSDQKALKYKDKIEIFLCNDIFSVLGELAKAQYNTSVLPYIIGITGTNGKTTTTYLLEYIFRKAGIPTGVIGTISYRWDGEEQESNLTTPGCLETHRLLSKMKNKVDVVLMEVSSHALDQRRIEGIEFDMAIFTNLSQDHLDYHKDMRSYFNAKKRLFSHYLKQGGLAITNLDDIYGKKLIDEGLALFGYTFFDENFIDISNTMLSEVILSNRAELIVEMEFRNKNWLSISSIVGRHNAYNMAAAQMAGLLFGLKESLFYSFKEFSGIPGRLEKVYSQHGTDVYVDYAHTPDGLKNVLLTIRELGYRRIILVFGCGGDRDKEKRSKMGKIASTYADFVVVTSDNPRSEEPEKIIDDILIGINTDNYVVEVNRRRAIEIALEEMEEGDAVVVAGKGHEKYQYVKGERLRFNDKEVILDTLKHMAYEV